MPGNRSGHLASGNPRRPGAGCLGLHRFTDLADARDTIQSWRVEHNRIRPQSSLNDATPEEFGERLNACFRGAT
ncbi:MAG: transposase [Deltaproteobacteria bacterium]|nr:transposase [Deltaproteobacteria bacterium]